ncbi:MAG: PfkB family carbohydrate kinase [Acidobacteria bacterium]|nr:PfkB family carbohydrate kinase [Acidobacteriota bacterium]
MMNDERTSLTGRLAALVRSFAERRVLVVGDLVADQFLFGEISRVSREAPVLILRHERTETVPGGAAGVDCGGVVTSPEARTTTKVRVLAGQSHSTRQQVIRVDYEGEPLRDPALRAQLSERTRQAAQDTDVVIVSDYNYGVADAETAEFLRGLTAQHATPVLVDSRFRLLEFDGFTSATPNEDEVEHVLGRRLESTGTLEAAGEELRARLCYKSLLITRGSRGMMLVEEGARPMHIEAVGGREAVDVTGAGDTVIATYALALASGANATDAAHLANHAGGLVVMKRGTACVASRELLASVTQEVE